MCEANQTFKCSCDVKKWFKYYKKPIALPTNNNNYLWIKLWCRNPGVDAENQQKSDNFQLSAFKDLQYNQVIEETVSNIS